MPSSLEEVVKEVKSATRITRWPPSPRWTIDWPYWENILPVPRYLLRECLRLRRRRRFPTRSRNLGVKKPYMITEFGVRGEWEIQPDANGVKLDPGDQERYDVIANGWKELIEAKRPLCLGAFVFHFSDSFDHTSLWLAFKSKGAKRPPYWATRKAFTGEDPKNWPPAIGDFMIAKATQAKKAGSVGARPPRREGPGKRQGRRPVRLSQARRLARHLRGDSPSTTVRQGRPVIGSRCLKSMAGFKLYALARDSYPNPLRVAVISAKAEK